MSGDESRFLEELMSGRLTRRGFLEGTAGLSLAGVIAACGGSSTPSASGPKVNTLNIGVADLTAPLEYDQFGETISAIHAGVVYQDAKGAIQPDLATSWTISSDQNTWTFALRQGVKAHDGSAFTANDLQTQFTRYTKVAALGGGGNQSAFVQAISHVNIIDDHHIAITFSSPYATVLEDMPCPIPTAYYNQVGEDAWVKAPIAFGPFKFGSSTINQSLNYEVFTNFWDKSRVVNFKTLKLILLREESARLQALESGSIDVAYDLTASSLQQLQGNSNVRLVTAPDTVVTFFLFNELGPKVEKFFPNSPLRIQGVREALALAIDLPTIAKKLYPGAATPANSPIVPSTIGFDAALKSTPYNPAKAKQLLQQAGQSGLTIQLNSKTADPYIPNVQDMGQAILSYWKDIGINATYVPIDSATLNAAYFGNTGNLSGATIRSTTSTDNTDAGTFADIHMDSTGSHPSNNDPQMTLLVHQLDNTIEPGARFALGKKLFAYIAQTWAAPPLLWFSTRVPIGNNVESLALRTGDAGPGPFFYLRARNGSIT